MKLRRTHEIDRGRMDITPLIDVVLLLLLFFMLSSSFVIHSGINVRLPESEAAQPYRESKLTVAITREERIYLEGKEIDIDSLREQMEFTSRDAPDTVVVLQADRDVKHGLVVSIMGIVKKAGLERLAIASKPAEKTEHKK
ncbi:MAG: biopolymer transporter ExbD [Candidatus Tritonobacter lacicola]|nr:biopolymer transporter ExbD [Candidatus Tritonobacter lacicola]